jgi:hypothetical protein
LKAVHQISASSTELQARSSWVSWFKLTPPYHVEVDGLHAAARRRRQVEEPHCAVGGPDVWRRKLILKAKFESG